MSFILGLAIGVAVGAIAHAAISAWAAKTAKTVETAAADAVTKA